MCYVPGYAIVSVPDPTPMIEWGTRKGLESVRISVCQLHCVYHMTWKHKNVNYSRVYAMAKEGEKKQKMNVCLIVPRE